MSTTDSPDGLEHRQPSRCTSLPAIGIPRDDIVIKPRRSLIPNATFNFPPIGNSSSLSHRDPVEALSQYDIDTINQGVQTYSIALESRAMMTSPIGQRTKSTMTKIIEQQHRGTVTVVTDQNSAGTMTILPNYHNRWTMTSPVLSESTHQSSETPSNPLSTSSTFVSIRPAQIMVKDTRARTKLYWEFLSCETSSKGKHIMGKN